MKQHRVIRPLAAAVTVAVLAVSCGGSSGGGDGTVVASIDGRTLTRGQLEQLLPDGDNTVDTWVAATVSSWLLAQAIEAELADRGYAPTEKELEDSRAIVDAREIARNEFEAEVFATSYALSLAVGRWSDDAQQDLEPPEPPGYLCSNHILFDTEEDALAGLERHTAGEDFAELAIELSTGPSGPNGGALGCAVEGRFVPAFEEAAYAGEAGQVVGPVETEFGWHLIEIESVGPATIDNHPDADSAELDALAAQARNAQIAGLVGEFEADATANHGPTAVVDASIGTLDPETFEISVG